MSESTHSRLANFLAINRTVGIVLLTVLLFGLGEQLWQPFLPLFLKSQSKAFTGDLAATGELSNVALWTIGIYAFLLNLFQGVCYIGGGQLTARLGDRGSLIFFGLLTIAGYIVFLFASNPWLTVLACMLILGWESLSMPVTFTTVGSTLEKEKRGMLSPCSRSRNDCRRYSAPRASVSCSIFSNARMPGTKPGSSRCLTWSERR